MTSDPKPLPQYVASDGCDVYGHPLRCESVATSHHTGLCDRHTVTERASLVAEVNALPERLRSWVHHLETDADPAGALRENFVLREAVAALGAKVDEAEAQRDRLAEACRSVMCQAGDYRESSWTCWTPIFDQVDESLAAIDKENA